MYRTPQALRSFGKIFTMLLPPFYASTFAQQAMDIGLLGIGIAMGLMTTLALTALFESIEFLEDPFGTIFYLQTASKFTLQRLTPRFLLQAVCHIRWH
jgi:hypothetical protein